MPSFDVFPVNGPTRLNPQPSSFSVKPPKFRSTLQKRPSSAPPDQLGSNTLYGFLQFLFILSLMLPMLYPLAHIIANNFYNKNKETLEHKVSVNRKLKSFLDMPPPLLTEQQQQYDTNTDVNFDELYNYINTRLKQQRALMQVSVDLPKSEILDTTQRQNYEKLNDLIKFVPFNGNQTQIFTTSIYNNSTNTTKFPIVVRKPIDSDIMSWSLYLQSKTGLLDIDQHFVAPFYAEPSVIKRFVTNTPQSLKIVCGGLDSKYTSKPFQTMYLTEFSLKGEYDSSSTDLSIKVDDMYTNAGIKLDSNVTVSYLMLAPNPNSTMQVEKLPRVTNFPEPSISPIIQDMLSEYQSFNYVYRKIGGTPQYEALMSTLSKIHSIPSRFGLSTSTYQSARVVTMPTNDNDEKVIRLPFVVILDNYKLASFQFRFMSKKGAIDLNKTAAVNVQYPMLVGKEEDGLTQRISISTASAFNDIVASDIMSKVYLFELVLKKEVFGSLVTPEIINSNLKNKDFLAAEADYLVSTTGRNINGFNDTLVEVIPWGFSEDQDLFSLNLIENSAKPPLPPSPLPPPPSPLSPPPPSPPSLVPPRPPPGPRSLPPFPLQNNSLEKQVRELRSLLIGTSSGIGGAIIAFVCIFLYCIRRKRSQVHPSYEVTDIVTELANVHVPQNPHDDMDVNSMVRLYLRCLPNIFKKIKVWPSSEPDLDPNELSQYGGMPLKSLMVKTKLMALKKQQLLAIVKPWKVKGITSQSNKEELVDLILKAYKRYCRVHKNKSK